MEEIKSQLLLRAAEQFIKAGFRSMSMDDLARELGISKKTLYLHFENKSDIIRQILLQTINSMEQHVRDIERKQLSAIEEFYAIFKIGCEEMRNLNPSLLFDLQKYFPESWQVFEQHKRTFIPASIERNLTKGIKEGVYRDDLNPHIIIQLHINNIDAILSGKLFDEKEYTILELYKEYVTYHLRGIVSKKGSEYLKKLF